MKVQVVKDFQIRAPRVLVVHVVLNLLKNAILYAQKNAKPVVGLTIGEIGDKPAISVIDNGPGIAKERVQYIFNRYYTTSKAGEGTGIGLSFCRMVMDGLGGAIEYNNHSTEGTEFILQFPSYSVRKSEPVEQST